MSYSSLIEKVQKESSIVKLVFKHGKEEAARLLGIEYKELLYQLARLVYLNDYPRFARERLWIIDKNSKLVQLNYNKAQAKLWNAIEKQKLAGKPVRICLLKARQWGGTTQIAGTIFGETILRENRSSMIIAHSLESAEHIRNMSERYYNRYNLRKPPIKKQTEKAWKFQHRQERKLVESSIRIDTAENLSAGHSFTLNNLHGSEIQSWPHADEIVKGLFPTVPNSTDTMIFFEGTGSGVGSYWYDFCTNAQREDSEWSFVFVPWFEIEDYQLPCDDNEKKRLEDTFDTDEEILFKGGVTVEYLKWRRREIKDTYKGDLDSFHQQYPSSADEAFLTSGRPVFPASLVKKNLSEAERVTFKIGNLIWKKKQDSTDRTQFIVNAVWEDDQKGWWKKWEEPENVENLYCAGADVAEGIAVEPEYGNRGGDFSAARVFRRDSRRMVATFHARCDPDLFAEELAKAFFYWKCHLLPEQNAGGGGSLVISRLKDIPEVVLLKTPIFGKKRDLEKQDEFGWETFKNTKRIAIDEMTEAIREGAYTDPDKGAWYECSTYVRDEKGRTNAQSRKYDDLVMATAITLQADKLMPMVFREGNVVKTVIERDMDIPENWKRYEKVQLETVMEENLLSW